MAIRAKRSGMLRSAAPTLAPPTLHPEGPRPLRRRGGADRRISCRDIRLYVLRRDATVPSADGAGCPFLTTHRGRGAGHTAVCPYTTRGCHSYASPVTTVGDPLSEREACSAGVRAILNPNHRRLGWSGRARSRRRARAG